MTHASLTETLAAYAYTLDAVGNRTALSETLVALAEVPGGAHLEQGGLLVLEAEHAGRVISDATHAWLTQTVQSGYTGTAYLRAMPDSGRLVASEAVSTAPRVEYPLYVSTPGTYTVWLRGRPAGRRGGGFGVRRAGGTGGGRERLRAGRLELGRPGAGRRDGRVAGERARAVHANRLAARGRAAHRPAAADGSGGLHADRGGAGRCGTPG